MTYAGVHFKHSRYIFCPIVKSNTGRAESLGIVLGKLGSLGFSAKCYGSHSLQAGGAMATGNLILPRMFTL